MIGILKRIVRKIRQEYPAIEIFIQADSGFSTPIFYKYAREARLIPNRYQDYDLEK